jgi:hypothetical protein
MDIKRLPLVLSSLMIIAASATAQTAPSIVMGLGTISLGDSTKDAISSLSRDYTVTAVKDNTSKEEKWLISNMGNKLKIPVATLYGRNGKVVGFQLNVEISDDPSAQNAFNYFFSLVSKLTKENHNRCTLTNGTSYLNGPLPLNKTFVDFACGPYYFYILKNEFYDNQSRESVDGYMLVESIGETE